MTAGDRRYKVVGATRTSRRSQAAMLVLDAPDRPTGLTAVLGDGGVLLSWDTPEIRGRCCQGPSRGDSPHGDRHG